VFEQFELPGDGGLMERNGFSNQIGLKQSFSLLRVVGRDVSGFSKIALIITKNHEGIPLDFKYE
jgi:hypothetical protein